MKISNFKIDGPGFDDTIQNESKLITIVQDHEAYLSVQKYKISKNLA